MKELQLNINRYELENTISSHYIGTLFHEHLDIYFMFTSFGRGTLSTTAYCHYSEFQEVVENTIKSIKDSGWQHETVEVNTQINLSQLPTHLKVMSGLDDEIINAFEFTRKTLPSNTALKAYGEWGAWW